MDSVLAILLLLTWLAVAAYHRLSMRWWLGVTFVLLLFYSYTHIFSDVGLVILWVIWAVTSFIGQANSLRCALFTKRFMRWFNRQQPRISTTEKQVLEAGGLWWEKAFFTGAPKWETLFQIETPALREDEQHFLDNQVTTLCSLLNDWEITSEKKDLSKEAWNYIKQEKFLGLVIEKKYGGHGFSALAHSAIVTKIATRSLSAALSVMVPNSLGPAELVHRYGTKEQQAYYLPRLANGEEIPCFGLTSLHAGSDATSIIDTGVVCREGDGLGIRLNFSKRYITLAPIATLVGLAIKLHDPEHLLGDKDNIGITVVLLDAKSKGVHSGDRHQPSHMGFMNGPISGKDVFIPIDNVVGGVERVGTGWRMLMECLSVGRGISLPALASAIGQVSYRTTGAYTLLREQFRRPIGAFEGVQSAMGEIAGLTYLCNAVREFTALAVDKDAKPAVASAITKYHLTELGRKMINAAMDVHGGRAVQSGPHNYLSNLYDGVPTTITVEGANILTRNLIIYGQGALRCHPFLQQEIIAAENPDDRNAVREFDRLLWKHVGFIASAFVRSWVYGLTGGRFITVTNKGKIAKKLRQLTRMSSAFVCVSECALSILGSELKIKEALSARLGDILSFQYLASAVVKYYMENGATQEDRPFCLWAVDYCLEKMQHAFDTFFQNFPKRGLARVLQFIIFPWGAQYRPPADQLTQDLANTMQQPSALRDRLTQYCYIGEDVDEPIARVEKAFMAVLACADSIAKLTTAQAEKTLPTGSLDKVIPLAKDAGVLSEEEVEALQLAQALRWQALEVDVFAQ